MGGRTSLDYSWFPFKTHSKPRKNLFRVCYCCNERKTLAYIYIYAYILIVFSVFVYVYSFIYVSNTYMYMYKYTYIYIYIFTSMSRYNPSSPSFRLAAKEQQGRGGFGDTAVHGNTRSLR